MQTEMKRKLEQQYLDKIDFKINSIIRKKEAHYIMTKRSIQEENIIIINIYAPNIGAPKYIRQILKDIKEIYSNTIIIGALGLPWWRSG